jgi:hypothetical protein
MMQPISNDIAKSKAKAKIKRILNSPRLYAKNFLKIRTKPGALVPMICNSVQEHLATIWDAEELAGKPVRLIVLKARREGISTYVQSRFFQFCATHKYRHAKVVAHASDATDTLFEMSKTFYDCMPTTVELVPGQKVRIKPIVERSNAKELVFGDLKSQLTLKTVGSDSENTASGSGAGRGETVQFLHCSEVAFWGAAKKTLTALLQTVANLPGTVVVLESTANGVGNHFHTLWIGAVNGDNDFVPVFLPWHIFEEYMIPLSDGETLEPYDDDEQALLKKYPNMTPEKLKWRRYTIRNECQGDVEQFHQEYPADDQEAFIITGRPYFDAKSLVAMRDKYQRKPLRRGYLEEDDNGYVTFIDEPKGYISIYEEPTPGGVYCIGADVAEGLAKGDYSDAQILRRGRGTPLDQVAVWHGHIDADLFGAELVKLAKYYNQCWIGIEVNNHGLTTNKAVIRLKYYRVYMRQRLDEQQPDDTDKLGWQTNTQTRPIMLDDLKKSIRDQSVIIHDYCTIEECFTFVVNDKGKPEATGDCKDDSVMALAVAVQMHQLCPMSGVDIPIPPIPGSGRRDFHSRLKQRDRQRDVASSVTGY